MTELKDEVTLKPCPQFCFWEWWNSLRDTERAAIIRDPQWSRERIFKAGYVQGINARPADDVVEALKQAKFAFEYCAGCDEGATYDVCESEIMSWAGSAAAVAYTRAIDALAKLEQTA